MCMARSVQGSVAFKAQYSFGVWIGHRAGHLYPTGRRRDGQVLEEEDIHTVLEEGLGRASFSV